MAVGPAPRRAAQRNDEAAGEVPKTKGRGEPLKFPPDLYSNESAQPI
jgi:hypothetical protein